MKNADGNVVSASSKAVYLFTGTVTGAVANLRSMMCPSGTTYWAYTSAGSVTGTCWACGAKLSEKYEENWCDGDFALGVRQASLDIDVDSPYITNGVVFAPSTVTLTTTTDGINVTVPTLDAPQSLTVRGNVLIVTPTINAQSVLVLDVLQSRLASGGR